MVASKERVPANIEEDKTAFIVCNGDKSWFLVRAETMNCKKRLPDSERWSGNNER